MRRKLVVALVVVFAVAWAWIALRPGPEEQLADLIAELRARGEPVTLAEVEGPMPPDDQNGASELAEALAWHAAHRSNDGGWALYGRPWNDDIRDAWLSNATPDQVASMHEFLDSLAPLFVLLDRCADKPEIAWPAPSYATAAEFLDQHPDFDDFHQITHLLEKRVLAGASEAERVRAMRTMFGIASSARPCGVLHALRLAALFERNCRCLRIALQRGLIDPADARLALDELLRVGWDARTADMVRARRARFLAVVPRWLDGSMQAELERRFGSGPSVLDRVEAQLNAAIRGRQILETGFEWDPDDVRELDRFLDPAYDAQSAWRETQDPTLTLGPLGEGVSSARVELVRCDALARLARVSLAACEHRQRHGDWPGTVDALAPLFPDGVPVDPYTGEPFVLERDGDALILSAQPWGGSPSPEVSEYRGYLWRLPARSQPVGATRRNR